MLKVLIVQRILSHYNIPLYESILEYHDLTLAYSEKSEDKNHRLHSIKTDYPSAADWKIMSPESVEHQIQQLTNLCGRYDVVILPMEPYSRILHVIERLRKHVKVLLWGIGVAAGYDCRYDSVELRKPSFESMAAMADAVIFYDSYPKQKYMKYGIPEDKMFIAPNTVQVDQTIPEGAARNTLLFVGTLLKQKRVDLLLESYKRACDKNPHVPVLKLIGGGEEYESVARWIEDHHMQDHVQLMGALYDERLLKEAFTGALAVLSADQAGLTVLKAMGYGAPFITASNAITGGERFNIENGVNGVLFDHPDELEQIILDIADHPEKYIQMGEAAYRYYHSCRTITHCRQGFLDAIRYAVRGE